MTSESPEEPKLIIDEDWKTQVQKEKELLQQKKSQESTDGLSSKPVEDRLETVQVEPMDEESSTASSKLDNASDLNDKELQPPPPASFEFLVSGMATQAIAAMGQIPGDDGQPLPVRLDYARHYIDLLGIIESKTAGNLSDSEQRFLQNTLHQLRMLFVSVKK